MKNKENFPHILNTSATLLGLCFVVLTSLKGSKFNEVSVIDEFTAFAILMFLTSSILSYLSMRSENDAKPSYERVADAVFLGGLFFLFVTTILIVMDVIR
ncbi:MAG TPA: hypothetical protein PLS51_00655 [Flavobacterium sp.]|jgi:hypothetical protein|nr:hypothetical protein [Flavobacterium sp.]HPJ09107.1 hypothetical protein [Flavobacterium sp.]